MTLLCRRFLLPVAAAVLSAAAALSVSFSEASDPEVPSRESRDRARTIPAPGPWPTATPDPDADRVSDRDEPRPGQPWPNLEREEWQYLTLGSMGSTRVRRDRMDHWRSRTDEAYRIVLGRQGTDRKVWHRYWGRNFSWRNEPYDATFEVMTQLFPESDYASSFDEYAAIRGGGYFGDPKSYVAGDWKYDPDSEIPGFTAWVEKYPGHPGQDDASYRLGRCFGIRGQYVAALKWFRRAREVPDGDMTRNARCWELLLLDALMTEDDLRVYASRDDPEAAYSLGLRRLRAGDPSGAVGWLTEAGEVGRDQLRAAREVGKLTTAIDRAGDTESRARAIYALGRRQYHDGSLYQNRLWEGWRRGTLLVNGVFAIWGHNRAPESYVRAIEGMDHRRQARRTFLRLVAECPGSSLVPKARYSAATAYAHSHGRHVEQVTVACPREAQIALAEEYRAIARDFPESTLADDALYFAGMFSGDPQAFAEILSRYPNGDMAEEALRQLPRARRRSRLTVEELAERVAQLADISDEEWPWHSWNTLQDLEDHLSFCVLEMTPLRGGERKRAIREFVSWFDGAKSHLTFDPSIGAYVLR